MSYRGLHSRLNGRLTAVACGAENPCPADLCSYDDAMPQKGSNHWSSTENNRNNARNVNFASGNTNNNNKYNSNVVRAVTASDDIVPAPFVRSVWDAYHDCLKGKMSSVQAIEYMSIAETDIPCLARELYTGTYKPGTSTCFLVRYPKWREVFAANFRDRIVHHWVCLRLEPLFEYRFVEQGNVSFNCRKGYGTDKAVEHVAKAMSRISDGYRKPAWVFKGDLVGFFMSINKDLLWYLLQRFIIRWRRRSELKGWASYGLVGMPEMYWDILLRTTKTVVMHHPEKDCVLNSQPHLWERHMEANKSLFTSPTGEPIGNLTTQLFANFLMSFFVSYVKYLYRGSNFDMAQFVDDFVIVCDDKRKILDSISKISSFLEDKLLLKMHGNKKYLQSVSHGVLFVGTYIKPGRLYLSNRTVGRMGERCEGFRRRLELCDYDLCDLQHIEQVLNSYLGFCKRRRTYHFRRAFMDEMGETFWRHFYVRGHYMSVRLKKKYKLLN